MLTGVVEVLLAKCHVSMPAGSDVKVALHLVALQAAIQTTAVWLDTPRQLGRLCKLLLLLCGAQIVVDVLFLIRAAPVAGLLLPLGGALA